MKNDLGRRPRAASTLGVSSEFPRVMAIVNGSLAKVPAGDMALPEPASVTFF